MDYVALFLALTAIAAVFAYAVRTGMPPTPTSPKVRAAMLAVLPDDLDGTILELGSGWGSLAFPLAHRFPACTVVGYELSPLPWLISRLRLMVDPKPNLRLRRADFRRVPLADATLVVCYLLPAAMAKLKPKLESELRPGALVLSNTFAVPGWQPLTTGKADDMYRSAIYLYRR